MRDLVRAAAAARDRLRRLGAFNVVSITLDAARAPRDSSSSMSPRPVAALLANSASSPTPSLKNLFGYCDTWDASGAFHFDHTAELSAGLEIPRIGALPTPLITRISLLSEDWLKASLKEHLMGVSVGLLSTMNHNLAYNLTWRTLNDPARISSNAIQDQLGHSLLSSVKYSYKVDQRDSSIRPTCGFGFLSSSQVEGLDPGSQYSRFLRQAAGVILPLAREPTGLVSLSQLPERFYLGGNRSLVCRLGGPSSLLGFKSRGLGVTHFGTSGPDNDSSKNGASTSPELNGHGGDIAVTAFADLSFDIPLKPLRDLGIHCHTFVSAGNLAKLTECDLRKFPLTSFLQTFRTSLGFGVVVPTRLFRLEVKYCHILKQFDHDKGKTGIQFNFSSP
ncbi:hypothetical protein PR202_ga04237 [Eleusine coracana subsp. coracana]|uniref:Bacterial surface antigen (D15) domain-containing protein n=1 Tax=Eleusine coracana subsp. coracana TaxID=191504 RepID=A0AAV5BR37_ELECO|nr:hypothetical protein PR202_ga04237 [Eleusine coracana subsp. coracana]